MSNNKIKLKTSEIGERLLNIYEEYFKSEYVYHNKITSAKSCYLNHYSDEKEMCSDNLIPVFSFRNISSRLIGKKYITELFDVTDYFVLLTFDYEINNAIRILKTLNLNKIIEVPKSNGQFLKHFAFFSFSDVKSLLS